MSMCWDHDKRPPGTTKWTLFLPLMIVSSMPLQVLGSLIHLFAIGAVVHSLESHTGLGAIHRVRCTSWVQIFLRPFNFWSCWVLAFKYCQKLMLKVSTFPLLSCCLIGVMFRLGVHPDLGLLGVASVLGFLLLPPAMQICGKRVFWVV